MKNQEKNRKPTLAPSFEPATIYLSPSTQCDPLPPPSHLRCSRWRGRIWGKYHISKVFMLMYVLMLLN
jgi:hypothetical protein